MVVECVWEREREGGGGGGEGGKRWLFNGGGGVCVCVGGGGGGILVLFNANDTWSAIISYNTPLQLPEQIDIKDIFY